MNVRELEYLSDWYVEHYDRLRPLYDAVLSPIQHNASQPNKQPLESQLEALINYLRGMAFDDLSLQQIAKLTDLGVYQFVGVEGVRFIEATVRTSDYDPSTAANRISEALSVLKSAYSGFNQYRSALEALGFDDHDDPESDNGVIIRVGFQKGASIDNVTDWKESSRDWYDIIRGLSMVSNESPEDTKIVGASTGSIILILVGTASVTTLLAIIAKNIASVAKEVVGISNVIEELRQNKWLTAAMERDFKKKIDQSRSKALSDIMKEIREIHKSIDGEKSTALEASIKKLLAFNEAGGSVDFVAPEDDDDQVDAGNEPMSALSQARVAIQDYQAAREQVRALTDMSNRQS